MSYYRVNTQVQMGVFLIKIITFFDVNDNQLCFHFLLEVIKRTEDSLKFNNLDIFIILQLHCFRIDYVIQLTGKQCLEEDTSYVRVKGKRNMFESVCVYKCANMSG